MEGGHGDSLSPCYHGSDMLRVRERDIEKALALDLAANCFTMTAASLLATTSLPCCLNAVAGRLAHCSLTTFPAAKLKPANILFIRSYLVFTPRSTFWSRVMDTASTLAAPSHSSGVNSSDKKAQ
jgi:hypothetical protein